ncbi:MAG: hypothetical protein ACOYNL_07175 [Rickettsiales bacterium]
MSLDDILDSNPSQPNKNFVRMTISDAMRDAAREFVMQQDAYAKVVVERPLDRDLEERQQVRLAQDHFEQTVYAANPHLDPFHIVKADGTADHVRRLDMKAAAGKMLNDLLSDAAQAAGKREYRPYREAPYPEVIGRG